MVFNKTVQKLSAKLA